MQGDVRRGAGWLDVLGQGAVQPKRRLRLPIGNGGCDIRLLWPCVPACSVQSVGDANIQQRGGRAQFARRRMVGGGCCTPRHSRYVYLGPHAAGNRLVEEIFEAQLNNFHESIVKNTLPAVSIEDGLQAIYITKEIIAKLVH